jgi:hypothetical protein
MGLEDNLKKNAFQLLTVYADTNMVLGLFYYSLSTAVFM